MTYDQITEQIKKKNSFLCIGLDIDINKIPGHLLDSEDPVFEFNRQIIDATHELCVAYKPNLAFYESLGPKGLISLEKTLSYIPETIFTIADAKRGDIGNTSAMYAKTFFEYYGFDSVTIAPYMGKDSIQPFLDFKNKWAIVLALTSNEGATDFQTLTVGSKKLFEDVLQKASTWGSKENMMFVVGATRAEMLADVRKIVPDHFLLIPGVGAQGGSLEDVCHYGLNDQVGLLINSSRQIIYASSGKDFATRAKQEAAKIKEQMKKFI